MAELCVFASVNLLDEFLFEQALDGAVERSRAESHAAAGLLRDLSHDSVTMQVLTRQGEQDLKCSRRQWVKFSFRHK